jgi:hypothetical protein
LGATIVLIYFFFQFLCRNLPRQALVTHTSRCYLISAPG